MKFNAPRADEEEFFEALAALELERATSKDAIPAPAKTRTTADTAPDAWLMARAPHGPSRAAGTTATPSGRR